MAINSDRDPIVAIATASGRGGVGIIRLSGEDAFIKAFIDQFFGSTECLKPRYAHYRPFKDESGSLIDEGLALYFPAPRSYTGESVLELQAHGGPVVMRLLLREVLAQGRASGLRLAEPGEFTKRAFLNGRMDLSQAEAVINLINAKTQTETRIAAKNLEGNLSKKIMELREELVELMAKIEVSVDYPEYDYEEVEPDSIVNLLDKKINEINNILKTYEHGKYIKNGVNVAILGKPNVGKSSLLNNLANYDKAIVTDIPGTTRDIVEETINLGDIVLNISDTAGIRDTDDIIEKIGVEKSLKILEEMDLVIYIINGQDGISKEDFEILSKIQNKGLKYILAINKIDVAQKDVLNAILKEIKQNKLNDPVFISVQENEGIENLKNEIIKLFNSNDLDYVHELIITNERHKNLLKKSVDYLYDAKKEISLGQPIDIVSIYVKKATKTLGEIIGADVTEDIISKIFEKFCLGK